MSNKNPNKTKIPVLTKEDIETLRVDDLQGDVDMDLKYQ